MTIEYEGFRVEVTPRANARHLKLFVRRGDPFFHLTVPPGVTRAQTEAFLRSNLPWMQANRDALVTWQPALAAGERHMVLGRRLTLGEGDTPTGTAFLTWRQRQLEALLRHLAPLWMDRMRARPSLIRFREMRSKWGNCQPATGIITLSTRLGMLPETLVEYVLVHELTHLRHPDHSSGFYRELGRFLPDYRERERQLKTFDWKPLKGDG